MTSKQLKFIEEYLSNGLNGRQAGLAAGYSERTVEAQVSRLLKNVNVKSRIKERLREILSETEVITLKWLDRVMDIAFSEPNMITNKSGDIITDHSNQLKALDLLGKYLSLYSDMKIDSGEESEKSKLSKEERREKIARLQNKLMRK